MLGTGISTCAYSTGGRGETTPDCRHVVVDQLAVTTRHCVEALRLKSAGRCSFAIGYQVDCILVSRPKRGTATALVAVQRSRRAWMILKESSYNKLYIEIICIIRRCLA